MAGAEDSLLVFDAQAAVTVSAILQAAAGGDSSNGARGGMGARATFDIERKSASVGYVRCCLTTELTVASPAVPSTATMTRRSLLGSTGSPGPVLLAGTTTQDPTRGRGVSCSLLWTVPSTTPFR